MSDLNSNVDKKISLDVLREEVMSCFKCPDLVKNRTQPVFGDGSINANILFCAEGPGYNEDKEGLPFVGDSGELLDNILKACQIERKNVYITNSVRCLSGLTKILTSDGWKPLYHLVKHKYKGKVACVDENGNKSWNHVYDWHRSLLGNRNLLKLHLKNSRNSSRGITGAVMTSDHRVLTKLGYKPIDHLNNDDLIHSGTYQPNYLVGEALIGTLLGDSQFSKNIFSCMHSLKQEKYLLHKAAIFGGSNIEYLQEIKNNKVFSKIRFSLRTTNYLRKLNKNLYINGRKSVTDYYLDRFTFVSLAYLFMDDGYLRIRNDGRRPRAEIATCSFTDIENQKLVDRIRSLGIDCYVNKRKYSRIYFDVSNTVLLSENIAPYVHESMNYKILDEHRKISKILFSSEREPFFDEYDVLPVKENLKWVYCIDVEKHGNFITRSGVVHNCRPPGNRNPSEEECSNCRDFLDRHIDIIKPKILVLLGSVASKNLLNGYVSSLRGRWHSYKSIPTLVTFHPAFLLRNPAAKKDAGKDFRMLIERLKLINKP